MSGYEDRIRAENVIKQNHQLGLDELKNENTFQHLPELKFISITQPIFGTDGIFKETGNLSEWMPLQFHLETSFASLKSNEKTVDFTLGNDTKNSFATERFDIHPSISLPLSYKNLITLTSTIGVRETFYTHRLHSSKNISEEFQGKSDNFGKRTDFSGDSALTRELFDFYLRLDAPRIYKTFGFDFLDISKLKHVIEPLIEYQYIPRVDQSAIIQTDPSDFIRGRELISYSIANHFYAKFKDRGDESEKSREVASLKISQYYDLRKDEQNKDMILNEGDLSNVSSNDIKNGRIDVHKRALSDLNVDMELYPAKHFLFNFNSFIDPSNGTLDRFIGSINFEQEILRAKLNASLAMRWTDPDKNQALDWLEPDYNPVFLIQSPSRNTFTTLKLDLKTPTSWEFGYLGRFYASEQSLSKNIFSINQREFALRTKYSSQCWSVEALYGIKEYFRENSSKKSFDDQLINDNFFWIVIELQSLGAFGPLSL